MEKEKTKEPKVCSRLMLKAVHKKKNSSLHLITRPPNENTRKELAILCKEMWETKSYKNKKYDTAY